MPRMPYDCSGVIPACLLPLHDDLSIDEKSYRSHLRDVAGVRGVSAITVNGHASEVSSCSFDEQQFLLETALDEIGDSTARRRAGFSLEEISGMFGNNGAPNLPRAALHEKAAALDRQIRQLTALRDTLRHVAECPAPSHMECPTDGLSRLPGSAAAKQLIKAA